MSSLVKTPSFQPGDHVKRLICGPFYHHAIVDEISADFAYVIHYQPPSVLQQENKKADHGNDYDHKEASKSKDDENHEDDTKCIILRSKENMSEFRLVYRPLNPKTVQHRARAMMSTQGKDTKYNIVLNNCEHFVNYCLLGENISEQIMIANRTFGLEVVGSMCGKRLGALAFVAAEFGPSLVNVLRKWLWTGEITADECGVQIIKQFSICRMFMVGASLAGAGATGALAVAFSLGPVGITLASIAGGCLAQEIAKRVFLRLKGLFFGNEDKQLSLECALKTLGFDGTQDYNAITDIEKAYRRLALKHHPDHGGDPEEFILIHTAMEVIRAAFEGKIARKRVIELREEAQELWMKSTQKQLDIYRELKAALMVECDQLTAYVSEQDEATRVNKELEHTLGHETQLAHEVQEKEQGVNSLEKEIQSLAALRDLVAISLNDEEEQKMNVQTFRRLTKRLIESRQQERNEVWNRRERSLFKFGFEKRIRFLDWELAGLRVNLGELDCQSKKSKKACSTLKMESEKLSRSINEKCELKKEAQTMLSKSIAALNKVQTKRREQETCQQSRECYVNTCKDELANQRETVRQLEDQRMETVRNTNKAETMEKVAEQEREKLQQNFGDLLDRMEAFKFTSLSNTVKRRMTEALEEARTALQDTVIAMKPQKDEANSCNIRAKALKASLKQRYETITAMTENRREQNDRHQDNLTSREIAFEKEKEAKTLKLGTATAEKRAELQKCFESWQKQPEGRRSCWNRK